jgi:hypothetical protein
MLHPIKVPSCYPALEWVVRLQRDLLAKLCEPATTAAIVTPQWVAAIRPECSDWLQKFTRWTHNKRGLLSVMRTIASATTTQKKAIFTYFEASQAFAESFDSAVLSPTVISTVQSLGADGLVSCLYTLLEAFYGLALQRGLPIDAHGNTGHGFNRSQFVDIFKEENFDRVCPFCDGDLNGPEVDHWLPKSKYPALSCHPKTSCRFVTAVTHRNVKASDVPSPLQITILSTIGFIPTRDLPTSISRLR